MPYEILITPSPYMNSLLHKQITAAIESIARDFAWKSGQISIAVVDDATIHEINRQYLHHDYPTDVISFDLTDTQQQIEGEIIVSWETAQRVARENGWNQDQELLLYVLHGMLHIVGLDDTTPEQAEKMREKERYYMQAITGNTENCTQAQ